MDRSKKSNEVVINSVLPLEIALVTGGLIYSIVNEKSKLVVVGSTTNLYQAIGRLMSTLETGSSEYGTLKEDLKDCIVSVLETCKRENTKIRTRYWVDYYKSRNYTEYKTTNPVLYTLHSEMNYYYGLPRYFVYLKNRRGDRTTIAMFERKKVMKEWIRQNYPDESRIGKVVVHESMLESIRDCSNKKRSSA